MKKTIFLFAACAAMIMSASFVACESGERVEDPEAKPIVPDTPDPELDPDSMTPDEQKKYLTDAGKAILNLFKTADQESAIELVDGLIYKLDEYDYDFSAVEDYAEEGVDAIYSTPKYISNVIQNKRTPMATPIYTYSFPKMSVIFEANDQTHKWVNKGKSTDNSIVFRMKSKDGTQCEAKCWGEGESRTYSYTYYVAETAADRYTYFPKFCYKGWNEGDYSEQWNSQTECYEYTYVGSNNGSYKFNTGSDFVYVGKGHGAYNRKDHYAYMWYDNDYDYYQHTEDRYEYVGNNQGCYKKITADDVQYRSVENCEYYYCTYSYVYDNQNGNYAKYKEYRLEYDDKPFAGAEERTVSAVLPAKIRFTFKNGTTTIVDATQNFDVVENDHYNMSGSYKVTNLTWENSLKLTHTSAIASLSMKYGTTSLISASINLPSFDIMKRGSSETYVEYAENVGDRWQDLLNEVGSITAEVDLMSKVQLKARISNMGGLFNIYTDWTKMHGVDLGDRLSLVEARDLRNIFNKYCLVGMYYGTDKLQAQMMLEPYAYEAREYVYDPYSGYPQVQYNMYYGLEPLIYFINDGTSYSYAQYFSENRFGSLIDLTEDVANTYLCLLKYNPVDPIELR